MGSLKTSGSKKGVMMSKRAVTIHGFSESLLRGQTRGILATSADEVIRRREKLQVQVHDRIIAKDKAMIVEKIQKQDQVIAMLNGMLGAQDVHHVKLVSHILKCKMAELKVQLESGHQDCIFIRLMGHDIRSVMDQLRVNVEAHFSYQYEEVKSLLYSHQC
ncbi:hypothetical protein Tco_0228153 [Tanacetum coccineum]